MSAPNVNDQVFILNIYPNPSNGKCAVDLPVGLKNSGHLVITDAMGRNVISRSVTNRETGEKIQLELNAGIYDVTISDATGQRWHSRAIVQ